MEKRIEVPYHVATNADIVDRTIFIFPARLRVVDIREVHGTAGTDGGAVTIALKHQTTTNTPAQGTALITDASSAGLNLKGTANTPQIGTLAAAGLLIGLAGDRLSHDIAGVTAVTALVCSTVSLEYC
jgi:hypothetical protein